MSSQAQSINVKVEFFGIGEQDYSRFPRIAKAIKNHAPTALDDFYKKVGKTPATQNFFSSTDQMNHAKAKQVAHWVNLFSGHVNSNYVAKAEQIGTIHARIGLEPTWYIGGYAQVLNHIILQMTGKSSLLSAKEIGHAVASMIKLALLDMDIALSSYFKAEEQSRLAVIDQLGEALAEVAKGNFSKTLTGLPAAYEQIEKDYERMRQEIQTALRSVADGSATMNTGAAEIRQASDDLANRTERQAASLEETAAAMEQLTVSVKETASGAVHMTKSVEETNREAQEGIRVVAEAVDAMDRIQGSASEISKIIEVIDGIAFQTNLLALNAGVEAARAGDAGKGFAVVASEVRLLAQRSAEAANSIKSLINSSVEQVGIGVKLVGASGHAFETIASKIDHVNSLASGISELSQTQATNLNQVNSAVREMDQMMQHNAAMVEQSNAAARSLSNEAQQLTQLVSGFILSDSSAGSGTAAYRKPQAYMAKVA